MHIFGKFYIYATYPWKKVVLYFTRSLSQKSWSVVPTFFQVTLADQLTYGNHQKHICCCACSSMCCAKSFSSRWQPWAFPVLELANVELGMFEQTLYWNLHCYHPSLPDYALTSIYLLKLHSICFKMWKLSFWLDTWEIEINNLSPIHLMKWQIWTIKEW